VEVEGRRGSGHLPDLRRTLFETLPTVEAGAQPGAIRYIDSSGIATLIEVLKDSQRRNKQFVLFG
jgi:ABC-type transporter Mla MlaB component